MAAGAIAVPRKAVVVSSAAFGWLMLIFAQPVS
jgi:hypothetical protein